MPTFSGQIKSRPTRKEGKGPSGRRKIRSTSWTIKQDNKAREGHSSGWCILKRGYGLWIILSKPVSTPPFLTQDKQHLTRKQLLLRMDTSISELFYEEKNLSPLPLLWLSRREMAAFGALSLYNWTLLKGQHAGNGSPFCSFHVSLLAGEGSTPTPDFSRIHPGPRLQVVQNMQGEGDWQMAKASQQSVKANGLLWLHAPGQVTEPSEIRLCPDLQGRSSHIWKIEIAHLMVF